MFRRILKIALFSVVGVVLFVLPPGAYLFMRYYRALEAEVVARFSGQRWNIPSRI